jgi:DNA-3-methyladenine glycosylase II
VRAAARLPLAPEELFGDHWALARVHWSTVDPILYAAAPEQHVPRPIDAYRTSFGALATAITHQQVSTAAGRAIATRTMTVCGGQWDPAALIMLTDEELRAAGLSRAKVRYLKALAEAEVRGELANLDSETDEAVTRRLVALPGIGVWTAQMFLLFHLRRPDIFSGDDLGLRMGIRVLDQLDQPPTPRQAEARAAVWQPYRSVASLVLWDLVRRSREKAS